MIVNYGKKIHNDSIAKTIQCNKLQYNNHDVHHDYNVHYNHVVQFCNILCGFPTFFD